MIAHRECNQAPRATVPLVVLLSLLDLLAHYDGDLHRLRDLALEAVPFLDTG